MIKDSRHFQFERASAWTVLRLANPDFFDRLITTELHDELIHFVETERPDKLVISFENVSRCPTEIINALLRTRKRVAAYGGELNLCGMRNEVRAVFKMLNLDGTVFGIYASVAEAGEAFAHGAET